jgi:hypothetical protein
MIVVAAASGCEFSESSSDTTGGNAACEAASQCNGVDNPINTCSASQDAYDCIILDLTKAAGEPDPMIFKAQVALESNFNELAISPDMPCKQSHGWPPDESKSYGLMQLTPDCGWLKAALLPNGHPNLEQDPTSALWATSVFNPTLNIQEGVRAIQVDRAAVKKRVTGCTEAQYTMMALAAFNQGEGTVVSCTDVGMLGKNYVNAVLNRYQLLARAAVYPYPY